MTDVVTVDIPDADELRDRLSRATAVLIAVATLVAAFVAYQHASATTQSSRTAATAHALAVDVLGATLDAEQAAQLELDRLQVRSEQQTVAANLLQQWAAAEEGSGAELEVRLRVSESLTHEVEESAGFASRDDTPEQDPLFPARLVARLSHPVYEGEAMEDAAIEESAEAGSRAAAFAGVLAILAVSVYLMGISLTIKRMTPRRALSAIGALLVVGASGWALTTSLGAPSSAERDNVRAAARAYADGQVAYQTAVGRADYETAVGHLSRAVKLRPGFAEAHAVLADAAFAAGSPQHSIYLSIATPEALELSTRHLNLAIDAGLRNAPIVNNLGWHTLLLGLQTDSADLARQSLALFDEAILTGGDPVYRYNRALALTALGRLDEARQAYHAGATIETDTAHYEMAGALTDLEILARYRPDLSEEAQDMKDLVVGAYWGTNPAPDPATAVSLADGVDHLFPGELQVVIDHVEVVAADSVAIIWYFNDPANSGWHVLPEVSGLAFVPEGAGAHSELRSLLESSVPVRCLEPGTYRAEIYLNGRMVDHVEASASFTTNVPTIFRELALGTCRPADWQRAEGVLGGALDGYVSAAQDRGIYVMSLNAAGSGMGAEGNALMLDTFVETFGQDLFTATPGLPGQALPEPYFMSLADPANVWYEYSGGEILAGAAVRDDALLIGVVFGPSSWWDTDEPYDLFDSLVTYDY